MHGALAQLGARNIRIVEAVGSNPICSMRTRGSEPCKGLGTSYFVFLYPSAFYPELPNGLLSGKSVIADRFLRSKELFSLKREGTSICVYIS